MTTITTKPKIFRTRAEKLGGHYHVRVFSASPGCTFANMGTLVMDEDDYVAFFAAFKADHKSEREP